MPEVAVHSPNLNGPSPRLDFSFSEASAAAEVLGTNLDALLHNRKVLGRNSKRALALLDTPATRGLGRFINMQRGAVLGGTLASTAVWSVLIDD